ncbi:MAG: TIGR03792 family protein [Cyanobium sp.]
MDGSLSGVAGADGRVEVAVVEHLRVSVPAAARAAWLEAEQGSWEPWLQRQPGFLGRDLRWDSEREEGQLLIHWASREQWLAISRPEIEAVQERFERLAQAALVRLGVTPSSEEQVGPGANPFPLVYEGELPPPPRAGAGESVVIPAPELPEAGASES